MTMNHLMKIYLLTISLSITFISCTYSTDISYRLDKNQEYIVEDGYIIDCNKEQFPTGDVLIVGTYTPETWGEGFYYDYLQGKKSKNLITILSANLSFPESKDSLTLSEIRKNGSYIFKSDSLTDIIERNKKIIVKIKYSDQSQKITTKEYELTRHKYTYSTGGFPHK